MPTVDTLTRLTLDALKTATGALLRGGSPAPWLSAMQKALTTAHTAAYLAGLGERSVGGKVRAWLSKLVGLRALPKVEREALKQLVGAQLDYLRGFAGALGGLSDAQIAARAALYAGAVRTSYNRARYPKMPFYPGEGSECKAQCKCAWQENGDGSYTWVLGAAEHCATCQSRAAGSPYRVE